MNTDSLPTKEANKEPLNPPIKWAGGKRWLVPALTKVYQEHGGRIVEPFCGAGAISFGLRPKYALLNDANAHLINFLQCVQQNLSLLPSGGNNRKDFLAARRNFNFLTPCPTREDANQLSFWSDDRLKAASLFYYLNRTCFNGLYRVNSKGEFNVPFGTYNTITYRQEFPEHVLAMKDWQVTNGDYTQVRTRFYDFVYVDPPYDSEFTTFTAGGFDWDDQVKLVEWLVKQKGLIIASNAATPRILKLYRANGFKLKIIDGPRRISSDGNRDKVKEVLAMRKK